MKDKDSLKLKLIFGQILKTSGYIVATLGILESILYTKEYWVIPIYLIGIFGLIMFEVLIYNMKKEIKELENE